jgi:hypothetical protein
MALCAICLLGAYGCGGGDGVWEASPFDVVRRRMQTHEGGKPLCALRVQGLGFRVEGLGFRV